MIDEFACAMPTATPASLFGLLNRICDDLVGVRLFTCSRFDLRAGQAERVYTNDPAAYPLTGLKEIVPNRWTGIVLDERRPFLSTHIDGVRDVFPDHEKIEALGLGSVINMPIFVSARFLGTVNLLHEDGWYDETSVSVLRPATLPSAIALMASEPVDPARET
jgi:GAF domain-containing protein